jgi:hypothetical protein
MKTKKIVVLKLELKEKELVLIALALRHYAERTGTKAEDERDCLQMNAQIHNILQD